MNDEYISADYFPEDGKEKGYLKVRLDNFDVVKKNTTQKDGKFGIYLSKARIGLISYVENGEIGSEKTVMWY